MWRLHSGPKSGESPFLHSLNQSQGRQVWEYVTNAGTQAEKQEVDRLRAEFTEHRHTQKHSSDEILRLNSRQRQSWRPQPSINPQEADLSPQYVARSLQDALFFYETLQAEDGHWPGDYGGPMFLMPGLVIACYITGILNLVLTDAHKTEMRRYLHNHQNDDGGYGLHIEGPSTMFGTTLNYVTLRILGVGPDEQICVRSRAWIHSRGGAVAVPSWGKFWLATLSAYAWEGLNPLPPEMWLLPYSAWTGIGLAHPGRYWCHCRMVYLPMCFIYGRRGALRATPLTEALRQELYTQPYSSINWDKARNACAREDMYYPHPKIQDVLWWALSRVEPWLQGTRLRGAALAEASRLIHYEDENTRYVCIGPVNKVLNMLACWLENPTSDAFKRHIPRLADYLWVAEDGMKMQGYNGSQLWDTAYAVQAIAATGIASEFSDCLRRAHHYIDVTQVREDCPQPLSRWYRHISKGAWPFSTQDHGWPIADCSAEGLKAALVLAKLDHKAVGKPLADERLFDCVNVILSYQNADGGWATYEKTRSYPILETINPSETFGDIIIDYTYVELSSAAITGLAAFKEARPQHRAGEVASSLSRGIQFIKQQQRPDGSWYASWAVCFTYGAWFGCGALAAVGQTVANSSEQRRACDFLLSKQQADGGWGESYLSCQDKVYSQLEGPSHAVNTAWAMLALLAAGQHTLDAQPLHWAALCLLRAQLPSGDWPQQHISGVFNRNCMITYANYRNIFPIWALGEYRQQVLSKSLPSNGHAH